ncbi:MAG: hypothetical protein K0R77_1338 [Chryseobacterium sp.]|jgi:hypothetical protein|uniref:hypothetical protein n=1 Tax=Chryseobacterium sp. TaxID=1871047 RepID=UPI002615ACF1|nr:hypothetical protein [Chryseobacterium sp.]MDF2552063.1 hypothetical protein [Chryseobacterium sp.]
MKKIIAIILIILAVEIQAQQTLSVNQVLGDTSVFGGVKSESGKSLKYEEIKGSPYFDTNFHQAKVADNYENVPIRYNTYKDEIEFQKDGKIQVLPKDVIFSKIEILKPKTTLVLIDTNDSMSGYFFELIGGKNTLYKKIKTEFKDVVPAANSYASEKPAIFRTNTPVYYIKTADGTFLKGLKNEKDALQSINGKSDELNTFFKSNKIKFNKEEDLIKFVNYLNTL